MKYINNDNCEYILKVYLSNDIEVFKLEYKLDDIKGILPLSNKGYYVLNLGHFSYLEIDEHEKCTYTLEEKTISYNDFYENYNVELSIIEKFENIKTDEKLYDDLDLNNPSDLYITFKRLLNMAHYISKNKTSKYVEELKYALNYIFANHYTGRENYTGNWWFFEIGIPRCINEIILLAKKHLASIDVYNYLNIERFYLPDAKYIFYRRNYPNIYREEATFANLADNIYICLIRAILQHNNEELDYLYNLIYDTIKYSNEKDGFYKDGGFIQHDNIPYTASYGEVLLNSVSKILEIYALIGRDCKKYVNHIYDLVFEVYLPFLYDGKAVESVRGRAVSRVKKNSGYSYKTIINSIGRLNKIQKDDRIEQYLYNENHNRIYETYTKAINSIDRFVWRNNHYLICVSANSSYIANYESINGENLYGDYSSNFTYELIFKNKEKTIFNILRNPYYRCGSTNSFTHEEPNLIVENNITAGVDYDGLLNACYHQNNSVIGYFSKIILPNSIVSLASNIKSSTEYISSIYSFDNEYVREENSITIGNQMRIFSKNNIIVEDIVDKISPFDINVNQSKEIFNIKQTRIYIKNPTEYEYQIYPYYENMDNNYSVIRKDSVHILKYDNYLFVNSFEEEVIKIGDIELKGKFSAIINDNNGILKIVLSTGKREKYSLELNSSNYELEYTDLEHNENKFITIDEFVHKIVLRRRII